jgi:hypothetical protein
LGYAPGSRHNLADTVPAFIVADQTTRGDVLMRLGEPDATFGETSFVYTSAYRKGGVGSLIVTYGEGGAMYGQRIAYRRLTIEFDESGVVKVAKIALKTCWQQGSKSMGTNYDYPRSGAASCPQPESASAPTVAPATEAQPPTTMPADKK